MAETANYGLYLEDDPSAKYYGWRLKMNGSDNSNMVKIDTALSEKADASITINGILSADSWTADGSSYTQTISDSQITSTQNGSISIGSPITDEQLQDVCAAKLIVSEQADGALTITAKGTKPTHDIPFTIIIVG